MSGIVPMLSRRRFLAVGGAALALPMVEVAQQQRAGTSLKALDREVQLTSAGDPTFFAKIESLFPGLTSDPNFKVIAPLTAILEHVKGSAVRAHSICWSLATPSGNFETPVFRYASPWSKRKGRRGKTLASAQADLLREGESVLVTPFFDLLPSEFAASPTGWHSLVKPSEPGAFLLSQAVAGATVSITFDAVIFKDRKFMGPDKYRLSRRVAASRNGEHDEARAILKLLKAGLSNEQIRSAIIARARTARFGVGRKGFYMQARKEFARIFLHKLANSDRDKFAFQILHVNKLHKTILRRIPEQSV
jgi:hypothetical protein